MYKARKMKIFIKQKIKIEWVQRGFEGCKAHSKSGQKISSCNVMSKYTIKNKARSLGVIKAHHEVCFS
jgi:hypothetical protein